MKDGGWKMKDEDWRMKIGGWRMEDGGWRMEDGGWSCQQSRITSPLTPIREANREGPQRGQRGEGRK
jgi:hypothetical protein